MPCQSVCSRLECVRIFLQSAADPLVRNAEGATPASVAAGCGYVACLRLLTRYGDEASTTHSMTLSAQRRAMMAAALSLSGEFEVVGRLDRIAAVWERVLNSAVNRTDNGPAGRDLVSSTRGTGRDGMMLTASDDDDIERLHVPDPEAMNVTSPVTKGYPQQVTSGSALPQWYRSVDSTSGCVYFWNEFGESLWSSARSASVAGDASTPWTRMIDASSGYSYMCDSVSGLCEWVNEPAVGGAGVAATTDAVDWWVLKIDPASGAGYFENARTFESEWCYEASVPDWLGSVSDPEMNAWSRSVDSSSGMSVFTNWRTSVVVWGAPLLA